MLIFSIILGLLALAVAAFAFGVGEYRHTKQQEQYSTLNQLVNQHLPLNGRQETTLALKRSTTVSEQITSEQDIPEGTKFIIQGIPYKSKAQAGRDLICDPVHLGDSINQSSYGIPFDRFMANRMSSRNKDKYEKSGHYRKVVEKYGAYPPPIDVPLLVICDEGIRKRASKIES